MKRVEAIADLFFSFQGRISCKMWWLAKFVVASVILLLYLVNHWLSALYYLRLFVVIGPVPYVAWSWFVLDVKRLHDRNRAGWWTFLSSICLGIYLLFFTSYEGAVYIGENPALPLLLFAVFIIYPAVQMAFLPGKAGQTDMVPRRSPSKSGGDLFRDEKRTERWG